MNPFPPGRPDADNDEGVRRHGITYEISGLSEGNNKVPAGWWVNVGNRTPKQGIVLQFPDRGQKSFGRRRRRGQILLLVDILPARCCLGLAASRLRTGYLGVSRPF